MANVNSAGLPVHQIWSESILTESVELNSVKPLEQKGCVRDRSVYVHPVLNPVENHSQWKALKSKAVQSVMALKENISAEQELPRIHQKFDQPKNQNQAEIEVNASLSIWLVSSGTHTAPEKTSFSGLDTILSANSTMYGGSNSMRSFEDRPILGAITVKELKQLLSSSSPKKSPSHEDASIIRSVGTYWNHSGSGTGSAASSFKGIPNTTSKYKEDKRVNWHSNPF